jgi:GMP synthase-like glutamine amidotransferase
MLRGVPFIGICLSHQLAAQAHVELVRDAVRRLESSQHGAFVEVSRRIAEVGANLQVKKGYGTIAKSWSDETFAVAKNEEVSHSNTRLYPYINIELDHVPTMVSEAHRVVAQKYEAIIDTALQYENELRIQAFHGNEVSEESVRFVCWAYQQIQHVMTAYSLDAASIPQIHALMGAPIGVEILASTHTQSGDPLCEVAATGIYWEGGQTAVTTQFHPELDESLLTTSQGWAPAWEDMKRSDGIRLLARMLCACLR